MNSVKLLTNSPNKLRIAKHSFAAYGIDVEAVRFSEPEIQAATSLEIARYAAQVAFRTIGGPVLREDHSFFIDELGIPGPFTAFTDKIVSAEQLVRIVDTLQSRAAHFEIAAAFIDVDGGSFDTSYTVPIEIARQPVGDPSLKWERVMMLPGSGQTFAETPAAERDHLWAKNYGLVAELMTSKALHQA